MRPYSGHMGAYKHTTKTMSSVRHVKAMPKTSGQSRNGLETLIFAVDLTVGSGVGSGVGICEMVGCDEMVGTGVGMGEIVGSGVGGMLGAGVGVAVGICVGCGEMVGYGLTVGSGDGMGVTVGCAVGCSNRSPRATQKCSWYGAARSWKWRPPSSWNSKLISASVVAATPLSAISSS